VPQPETPELNSSLKRNSLFALAGVLLCTILTFASTFKFGWVYDDVPQIPQNQNLQWSRLGFLFTHHLWASAAGTEGRYYRPFLTLWFLINKSLFGLNPHGFHVTTVFSHVAASALAFFVARTLLKDTSAALFATAIFAFHPLHAESASWISSVNDSFAAALCFASFLIYRKARSTQHSPAGWWALAGTLFLLALFTKEVSIVLPGIILVDLWSGSNGNSRAVPSSRAWLLAPILTFGSMSILWLALRSWVLGSSAAASSSLPSSADLVNVPKIVLFNLYRIVLPLHLSPHYDFVLIQSPINGQFLFTCLALIALASLAITAARRDPTFWVAIAWLILPMLPTLNLRWMNEDDFVHDRYLYMSVLGAALLAGSAYAWVRKKWPQQQLVRPLAASLVVLLAFASAIQSQYWANDVILFSRAVAVAPNNEWAQLNYGSALSSRGRYGEAAPHFVRSYELKPGWRAADFAGFAYLQSGDLLPSEHWFTTALQQNPALATAWFGLAQIRLLQHRPEEAIPYFKKALEIEPAADGYNYAMGTALEQLGQKSLAIEEYKIELQLHPYQTGARKAIDRLQSTSPPE
jgi:tetratricopeptide (TPR) repeat protein